LPTISPNRASCISFFFHKTRRGPARSCPSGRDRTRVNSAGLISRWCRVNCLLEETARCASDAEPLAALGAPGIKNFASTTSGHPRAKTMGTLALDIARLKSSFHQFSPGSSELCCLVDYSQVQRTKRRERDSKNAHRGCQRTIIVSLKEIMVVVC